MDHAVRNILQDTLAAKEMGIDVYNTHNVESQIMIKSRVVCGCHDYIERGRFLRKASESFKRTAHYGMKSPFPTIQSSERLIVIREWKRSCREQGVTTAEWLAQNVIHTVKCSWGINHALHESMGTMTGMRIFSSQRVVHREYTE